MDNVEAVFISPADPAPEAMWHVRIYGIYGKQLIQSDQSRKTADSGQAAALGRCTPFCRR
jgi:hypothetical protein